ncbi:MAG: adenylosuccinate synthase [Bacteroidales bacterium]|nr:adenylosuccinate synthase [Bacteroidales bacterium]MDY6348716.1 adenylosuccinate synthase [Bacteroidales bacterium]
MNIDILLGMQWGDEGKGKVVDVLTPAYDVVARFQGGPNAGHSLEFNGKRHVLHIIPSGIFHEDKANIIGNGVVIDPAVFEDEILELEKMGLAPAKNLFISRRAHLILPTHKLLDAAQESRKGEGKIGSTLKGIGPAYTDKTARAGLRVCDLETPDFEERLNERMEEHKAVLDSYGFEYGDVLPNMVEKWLKSLGTLRKFKFIDAEYELSNYLKEGKTVLAEGAQGTLLDLEFGAYPFVTSSNTVAAGAFSGLGLAPCLTGRVFGIVKAYCTRVGSGPFPTELFDETGDYLRKTGNEYGATTGRPRRCGWLDLVALKYAVMINGVTDIALTKADVLSGMPEIKVCTAYKVNGTMTDRIPADNKAVVEPVYTSLRGWQEDISKCREYDELPQTFKDYIRFVETETGARVSIVSVSPDRNATIFRKD